jgi:DNA-binding LytR/AlgR family response regulator
MIKAIAIDDEPLALDIVQAFCNRVDFIDLQKTFTKPQEALKYLKKFPADLLFLDIKMPSISGIEFYKVVQKEMMVIFTTAHSEYAVESYNLNAIDYLLKPFEEERFLQAVNKANDYYNYLHHTEKSPKPFFYVRADYGISKINFADVLYVECIDDYLKIHLPNRSPIVPRMTMKEIMEKLPAAEFVRVHRSYIVPLSRIQNVRNKIIYLPEAEIPIGKIFEENFFSQFSS